MVPGYYAQLPMGLCFGHPFETIDQRKSRKGSYYKSLTMTLPLSFEPHEEETKRLSGAREDRNDIVSLFNAKTSNACEHKYRYRYSEQSKRLFLRLVIY